MSLGGLLALIVLLNGLLLSFGKGQFLRARIRGGTLASAPIHYGIFITLISFIAAMLLIIVWLSAESWLLQNMLLARLGEYLPNAAQEKIHFIASQIEGARAGFTFDNPFYTESHAAYLAHKNMSRAGMNISAVGLTLVLGGGLLLFIKPSHPVQKLNEKIANGLMFACASVAVLITFGVFLSLISETIRFFELVPPLEFLFGLEWSPQIALRAGQVAAEGKFGAVPLFAGTLMITLIAVAIAGPIGLMSAIYMSEYASERVHLVAKPILEILAGIPTVVYGFFAALALAPFIRSLGERLGLAATSESALAAGIVIGIMIIPFISSLSDDVISAVPHNLREGSYALGATQSETIIKVVLPAALPGIASAFLLAISRAIGETMIVVMAAGLAASLTANPLESVTTVTVQIVTLLVGDQEFNSPKTLAAFALGMTLFVITLFLNTMARVIVNKYREQYD